MTNQDNNTTHTSDTSVQNASLHLNTSLEDCPFFNDSVNEKSVEMRTNMESYTKQKQEGFQPPKNVKSEFSDQKKKPTECLKLGVAMHAGIQELHTLATSSSFTQSFVRGNIGTDEYGLYLNSLYFIYNTLESLLEKHKKNPAVNLIHFPKELNRRESILKDLAFFYGEDKVGDLISPKNMISTVKSYVSAMEKASKTESALLIAHSYSRYLGDLNGGPTFLRGLKKHILKYDVNTTIWDSTEGSNFYQFNNLGNEAEFKGIYRERLNCTNLNAETQEMVVKEAAKSIRLNIAMFNEIREISESGQLASTNIKSSDMSSPYQKMNRQKSVQNLWVYTAIALVAFIGIRAYSNYSK
ncbi:heme oxygenase-domain-containing protein [Sporodiniella umbellata]|nr:heme oxygenase-domain-containing protein [Sporodiniella umbellata]